jgi:hypothetical protein
VSHQTDPATPRHGHPRRWTRWDSATAVERPVPWLIAALVFLVNAVLSVTRADWWLAALEVATGILALGSASAVASRAKPPSGG